jgi:DNA-binding NarL/FixJ family response regulator
MAASVVLADDHPLVRQGMRMLLEREQFQILGEAADGAAAVELAKRYRPDVVVLDFAMPTLDGISAAREITIVSAKSRMVLLTMYTEEHHVVEAFRSGVRGCVSKTQAPEHLLRAIREVCAGGRYLSPDLTATVVDPDLARTTPPEDPLTTRERQVLQLVAEGRTTKEIAIILGITVKTAESHRTRLMEKLDLHSTAVLVRYAIRRGLVQA